jgi:hypothetical protein
MNFHKHLIILLLFITTVLADLKECTNIGVDVDCTCPRSGGNPVCSTDNKMYRSLCWLYKAARTNVSIQFKKYGAC